MRTNRLVTLALAGWPCTVLVAFAARSAFNDDVVSLPELAGWMASAWGPVAMLVTGAFFVTPRGLSVSKSGIDGRRERRGR